MAQAEKIKPQRTRSRRVESWIYGVINVVIEALEVETTLLEKGNASWRFYNKELEFLQPWSFYLRADGRHILRDFARHKPEIVRHLERHDVLLVQVRDAASVAFDAILRDPEFRVAVGNAEAAFRGHQPPALPITGAFPPERLPDLVAERIVNAVDEVPRHHTDATFWAAHGVELRRFGKGPEYEALTNAKLLLLKSDTATISWLHETSFELCEKYDVPAAPISSSTE